MMRRVLSSVATIVFAMTMVMLSPGPAQTLGQGTPVTVGPGPQNVWNSFSINGLESNAWNAIGISSAASYDLQVGGYVSFGFAGTCRFQVWNGNNGLGPTNPSAWRTFSFSNAATLLHANSSDLPLDTPTTVSASVLEVFDFVPVIAGTYTVNLSAPSGTNWFVYFPSGGGAWLDRSLANYTSALLQTSFNLSVPNPTLQPFALVVARDGGSPIGTFTVTISAPSPPSIPATLAPPCGATDVSTIPMLSWTAATGQSPVNYDIEVAVDAGFTNVVAGQSGLSGSSYAPSAPLATNTDHYWHVRASNSIGASDWSRTCTFTTGVPIAITTPCPLPPATVGGAYSLQLTASGGTPPYSWAVTSGALPSGMNLSASGLVSGAPAATGPFSFTLHVTDGSTLPGSTPCSLYVPAASGTNWIQRSPAASPSGRLSYGLANDAARGVVVLFGGFNGPLLSDTWEWDGTNWILRNPGTSPAGRYMHGMAYDAARGRVVVFGGANNALNSFSDTWEWDGTTWTHPIPTSSPPARFRHAMAYDAARARVVLFGGNSLFPTNVFSDTWEWDGTAWTHPMPASSPPGRTRHAMVYDAARGRVVLFGGGTGTSIFSDTWEWNGTTWIHPIPATSPPGRFAHAMAYDAARGRVVLFGGANNSGLLSDSWEWDGTTWTQRSPATIPPARYDHAMAYDAARGRLMTFGGNPSTVPFSVFSDTWEYFASCDVVGLGHPGGGLPLACATPPQVGTNFCLSFPSVNAQGILALGFTPPVSPSLPLNPPTTCAPGAAYLVPYVLLPVSGDPATVCFSVPPLPAIAGQSFCLQGAAIMASGCAQLTDAVVVTIQP